VESRLEQTRTERRDEDAVLLYVKFLCKTMVLLISFLSGGLWRIEQKLAHSMKETSNSLQNYGIINLQDHGNNDRCMYCFFRIHERGSWQSERMVKIRLRFAHFPMSW